MTEQQLFDDENIRSMVRHNSPRTSVDAARRVKPKATALQAQILEAFQQNGPMTDRELERLPQFAHLAPSTARKRRSELFHAGRLIDTGDVHEGLTIWAAA